MTANSARKTFAQASPRARARARARRRRTESRQQGFALLLSLVAITILAVLVTDLHETTGTSFAAAMAERDQLRAEYMAKSGVNLTRMLIGQEPNLRQLVSPIYQLLLKRRAPQLPVWQYANIVLKPFADFEASKEDVAGAGYDLGLAEGLGELSGSFEVEGTAENGKINLNDPRIQDLAVGHAHVAAQAYSLMGGFQPSPNKYDPLFSQFDEKGRLTTRLDVVANIIDWWDFDEQRTNYDPVLGTANSSGGEDVDYYRSLPDAYAIKNAPFDTIEELRLVRGISDDFWATFVEPTLDDPKARLVTVYGASKVNPNEAAPEVILARVCTFKELREQLLCNDPTGAEPLKFITLLNVARSLAPIPWFSSSREFVKFLRGSGEGLYGMLVQLLGSMGQEAMIFTPLQIESPQVATQLRSTFAPKTSIISIEVTGKSGRSQKRIRTVVNIDPRWTPPPPNAGKLPPLGVLSYYRID